MSFVRFWIVSLISVRIYPSYLLTAFLYYLSFGGIAFYIFETQYFVSLDMFADYMRTLSPYALMSHVVFEIFLGNVIIGDIFMAVFDVKEAKKEAKKEVRNYGT